MSKDSKLAKQEMGTLLSFIPTGEYYFAKGLKAYQRRDFHNAKKYLERALNLEPGEPMIACQLAIVHTELGDFKESNRLLHMILEEWDDDMVECHYFLANNYAHLGYFKDAYNHATLYMKLEEDGEFAEDTEDLLDLLRLEAEDIEEDLYEHDDLIAQQEEARELLETGEFLKATKLLTRVIDEFPEYWSAYNNLALAHFYLGDAGKANDILNEVLRKNPGNLHALCNKLVFAYYNKDHQSVQNLKETLIKIKPLLIEHQYKLGTTFALIGEYEVAYSWLKKLYKQGFDGDGPFYYWLSYSAYFIGKQKTAEKSWKKVLQINPEKEGHEPWNADRPGMSGFENQKVLIEKKLQSDYPEERLFGLFLTFLSSDKEEILASYQANSPLERQYLQMMTDQSDSFYSMIEVGHETAKQLYDMYQPIGSVEAGLYLMWFSALVEMEKNEVSIKNEKACAAAIEYLWRRLRNEHYSQAHFADQYGLSTSTIRKYVKVLKKYLH